MLLGQFPRDEAITILPENSPITGPFQAA
jgi:hypothetical protein